MLNCCSGCSAWQKGRASSSESITRDTQVLLKHWALHKGLTLPALSCPSQKVYHTLPAWGISSSPMWPLRESGGKPDSSHILAQTCTSTLSLLLFHFSIAAWSCICFPDTFSLLPNSPTRPSGSATEREGRVTEQAGGLSGQQRKVPFV